jgi:hypothetical protein
MNGRCADLTKRFCLWLLCLFILEALYFSADFLLFGDSTALTVGRLIVWFLLWCMGGLNG